MRKYRNHSGIEENKHLYSIWIGMKRRCYNEKCDRYKDYGARGISICNDWLSNFDNFADWAHENGYCIGLSIERNDVNGDYEPNNCCWISLSKQKLNTRQTKWIEYKGERKPLVVWCEELDLPYDAIHNRIDQGWDVEKAFITPLFNSDDSFSKKCRDHNLNPATVRDRIVKFGWSEEKALNTPCNGRGTRPNGEYVDKHISEKCRVCGREFIKNNSKQIYCGYRCRKIAKRKSWRKTGKIINYKNVSVNPDYIKEEL